LVGGKTDFLFRKVALDRLRSPEQLDQAITVTSRGSWLALAATGILALLLVVWSVFGQVPVRVDGQGILISTGGQVSDAVTLTSGRLMAPTVDEGDVVRQGQQLARLDVPDLAERAADSSSQAGELESNAYQARSEISAIAAARSTNLTAQLEALRITAEAAEQRQRAYSDQLADQRSMAERGFITRQTLQQLQEQIANARAAGADARSRMLALRAEQLRDSSTDARQDADRRERARTARQSAAALSSELRRSSIVTSPVNGQLIEWKAAFGTYLPAGVPVASIASGAHGLQFMLFLSATNGKQVSPGMEVRIELNGLPREQWGTLVGRVASVSRFPATREGMLAVLHNEALVASLSAGGAPFLTRIDLQPDTRTGNGYRWSGGPGPATALSGGATGTARVTILEQRPISYVFGFLRKASGE